jgi:hypothetical protein
MPKPPMTQRQKAFAHGYERGSVFDSLSEPERKVKEAQLSDRRYRRSTKSISEV